MPTESGGSVRDERVEPSLKPVAPLKVVPKVRFDDSRYVNGVAAMESERKMIHITRMVELMGKIKGMS